MKFKFFIALLIFLLFSLFVLGQKDSLRKVIYKNENAPEVMKAYASLAYQFHLSNPDTTISLALECVALSHNNENLFEKASCQNSLGLGYYRKGLYNSAIRAYNDALVYYESVDNREQAARVYLNIAHVYQSLKNFKNAQKYALKALKEYENQKDSMRIAVTFQVISTIYRELHDFEKAENYLDQSIVILRKLNKTGEFANSLCLKGSLYLSQKKLDLAKLQFLQAIEIYKPVNDLANQAIAHENLAEVFEKQNDNKQAVFHYQKALSLFTAIDSKADIAYEKMRMSKPLASIGQFKTSELYLNEAELYFIEEKLIEYLSELYERKSDVYLLQNKNDEALEYYKKHIEVRDSIESIQRQNEILRLQTEFETERKEQEINVLQIKQEKQLANLRVRSLIIYSLIVLFILAIAFALFWRRRIRLKQELRKQTLLNQIASDLHDDVGATLSSIKMFGEIIQNKTKSLNPEIEIIAKKIKENSEETILAMSDIVWAIKPGNENLKSLQDKIFQTAVDFCSSKNIQLEFQGFDDKHHNIILDVELKKDIYLIVKEAINNAVKYSDCKDIKVKLNILDNSISITISDNGRGIDDNFTHGNGIQNMKHRCEMNHGNFILETSSEKGTSIKVKIPIVD